jgi:hypothetical protein
MLSDIGVGNAFFVSDPKAQATKAKINNCKYIKLKASEK